MKSAAGAGRPGSPPAAPAAGGRRPGTFRDPHRPAARPLFRTFAGVQAYAGISNVVSGGAPLAAAGTLPDKARWPLSGLKGPPRSSASGSPSPCPGTRPHTAVHRLARTCRPGHLRRRLASGRVAAPHRPASPGAPRRAPPARRGAGASFSLFFRSPLLFRQRCAAGRLRRPAGIPPCDGIRQMHLGAQQQVHGF